MLVHTVFFTLRPELSASERADFLQHGLESLRSIPQLKAYYVGKPAPTPARQVVGTDYSFAITGVFDDIAAHDAYQVHPVHAAFVRRFSTYWTQVRVYDYA